MEPWQRVWIDAEAFEEDRHSRISCIECHGGQTSDDMATAHEGLVVSPSSDPSLCGDCHEDISDANENSLHTTLRGYDTILHERSVPENHATLENMEANHCTSCHTTCADCHITQPASVGGGLLKGHDFVETPPMGQTCTACHGSRIKNEYYGSNEGIPADVHFRNRMGCVDCHTGDEMHGMENENAAHRYDGEIIPTCESCHEDQIGEGSGIEQHEIHGTDTLSCQGCHSTTYTNCVNCHVEKSDEGIPFYMVDSHSLDFALGLNMLQSEDRPYKYVPLRHVPIDIDSFSFYGDNLLPNFNNRPTWAYATPHNIQRITPQNESCESCHANDAIFLTADRIAPEELEANRSVIVEHAPPLPEGYEAAQPEESETEEEDSGDDFWGSD